MNRDVKRFLIVCVSFLVVVIVTPIIFHIGYNMHRDMKISRLEEKVSLELKELDRPLGEGETMESRFERLRIALNKNRASLPDIGFSDVVVHHKLRLSSL